MQVLRAQPGPIIGESDDEASSKTAFAVHLEIFTGPFDLLLSLIAKRRLDVTLVALSQVTDEFIAHIRAAGEDWDLDQASEFLVIAATLLDLKIARLLPGQQLDDDEDLALLEARDLLFARLLQYRAFRQMAAWLRERSEAADLTWPRSVSAEPAYANLVPPTVLDLTAADLARLLAQADHPRPIQTVDIGHLHAPAVSVREQAVIVAQRLRASGVMTFRRLIADAEATVVIVARFLALLELYRESAVLFDQLQPLGELQIRWTGQDPDVDRIDLDDYSGSLVSESDPARAAEALLDPDLVSQR